MRCLTRILLSLALAFSPTAYAEIPSLMNYQGRLTEASGQAVQGAVSMTFRLYDAATGGSELWKEDHAFTLAEIDDGIFNVILGSVTALTAVKFNNPLWISVQVSGDAEMSPRQRLTSTGYAINADKLDALDSSSFLRTDVDTSTSGKLTLTRSGTALLVKPTTDPAADTKLIDVQNAAGTTQFSVDLEGDVTVDGDLTVTGLVSGSVVSSSTTSNSWTTGSATDATANTISLLFGQAAGQESIIFQGASNDDFAFSDDIRLSTQGQLRFEDDAGGEYIALKAPTGVTTHTLTLPAALGGAGQLLTTDASGTLSWTTVAAGGGDVTDVGNCAGPACFTGASGSTLTFDGGANDGTLQIAALGASRTWTLPNATGTLITTGDVDTVTGTMIAADTVTSAEIGAEAVGTSELAASGVTANTYGSATAVPQIAVDVDGRITSASNVTISVGSANIADDSLDFDKFEDTLDLDTATEVNLGAVNLTVDLDSSGDFVIADAGVAKHTFEDDGDISFTGDLLLDTTGTSGAAVGTATSAASLALAMDPTAADADAVIKMGRNGSDWEYFLWDDDYVAGAQTGWFYFSDGISMERLNVRGSSPAMITFGSGSSAQALQFDPTTQEFTFTGGQFAHEFDNLIANASFESPDPGAWQDHNSGGVNPPTSTARFGARAARVLDGSAAAARGIKHAILFPDRFKGKPMTLAVWARHSAAAGSVTASLGFNDGVTAAASRFTNITTTPTSQRFTYTFTVDASATVLEVLLYGAGSGDSDATQSNGTTEIYYDGVTLVPGTMALPYKPRPITDTGDQTIFGDLTIAADMNPNLAGSIGTLAFGRPFDIAPDAFSPLAKTLKWVKDTNRFEFNQDVFTAATVQLQEVSAPANPAADQLKLYAIDEAGVTRLAYKDSTGTQTLLTTTSGGTVTSISQGVGIALSPNPITASGTVAIDTAIVPRKTVANLFDPGATDLTPITIRQTSAASPTAAVFTVTNNAGTTPYLSIDAQGEVGIGTTSPASRLHGATTLSAATGNEVAYQLHYTTNKATSGNDTGLLLSMTDTTSPGTSLPLDIQVGGVSRFAVNASGQLTAGDVPWVRVSGAPGFLTDDTAVPKNHLVNAGVLGFTWAPSELASPVMVEGENLSLLTNDPGYITSADDTVSGAELDGVFATTGLLRRTGVATYSTLPDNSANWDTAYTDRLKWDGGATGLDAATGRSALGLGALATLAAVSGGPGGTLTDGTLTTADLAPGSFSAITGVGTLGSLTVSGETHLATTSGSVGIGTTAPQALLDVKGATRLGGSTADYTAISSTGVTTYVGTAQPKRTIVLTAAGAIIPASNAPQQLKTNGTNVSYYTLNYSGTAPAAESAYWQFTVPDSYTGTTVTATLYWLTSSTTTANAVKWFVDMNGYGDAQTLDQALNTAGTVVDNPSSVANQVLVTSEITGITTGWTAGEYAVVRVQRNAADATDTEAALAELLMVKLEWTASAESD